MADILYIYVMLHVRNDREVAISIVFIEAGNITVCIYVCVYICICMRVYMHVSTDVCLCVYVHAHT